MKPDNTEKINKTIQENNAIPLFYIESGSRLWRMASPDSDFDVRGFHLPSKKDYFDFKKRRDVIEKMDGDFDFSSFTLDKMFGLLSKSNATIFEWIRSDIVYLNEFPSWKDFQLGLIANIDFRALFYHYLYLAANTYELMASDKKFTYKTALYCIRGILSAKMALEQALPPLIIHDLFNEVGSDNSIVQIGQNCHLNKKDQSEKQPVTESERDSLLQNLRENIEALKKETMKSTNDPKKISDFLTDFSLSLKNKYYSGAE